MVIDHIMVPWLPFLSGSLGTCYSVIFLVAIGIAVVAVVVSGFLFFVYTSVVVVFFVVGQHLFSFNAFLMGNAMLAFRVCFRCVFVY